VTSNGAELTEMLASMLVPKGTVSSWAATFPCRCGAINRLRERQQESLDQVNAATKPGADRLMGHLAWAGQGFAEEVAAIEQHCVCPGRPS
jgi:hypothetical protein